MKPVIVCLFKHTSDFIHGWLCLIYVGDFIFHISKLLRSSLSTPPPSFKVALIVTNTNFLWVYRVIGKNSHNPGKRAMYGLHSSCVGRTHCYKTFKCVIPSKMVGSHWGEWSLENTVSCVAPRGTDGIRGLILRGQKSVDGEGKVTVSSQCQC